MPAEQLPTLTLARTLPKTADVLVVGLRGTAEENELVGVPDSVEKALGKKLGNLRELATSLGAKPTHGSTQALPGAGGPLLMVVGLGSDAVTPERLRKAAGAGVRAAAGTGATGQHVAVSLDTDEPELIRAVAEGALLGTYTYRPISSAAADDPAVGSITLLAGSAGRKGTATDAAHQARTIAQAVATAREWVNVPPNLLYPETFAEEARALAKDTRIQVEVLDEKALAKGAFGGLLAVGGGSSRPPRLVRLTYSPRGATTHLALVGKGITFDSGGLNIKPGGSMLTMKCDMAGAASVLAATRAIADLGLKIKVTCYAALAENLPSDTAYRPSDVLTMYGGKTVENGNCDAEGRLVMADALARAGEDTPDLVVDVATLTGACVVALGDRTGGVMSNDEATAAAVLDAAETAGEDFWQLPIPEDFAGQLESKVADLKSTGSGRMGGAMIAAAFLREFVGDTPWAHLDIAGPGFHEGAPYGYVGPGGTGVGVRTVVQLATDLAG